MIGTNWQPLPDSPGQWLCKIRTREEKSTHYLSLDIKEVFPTCDFYNDYKWRKNQYVITPPPYVCLFANYIKNTGVGNSVIFAGDWIFYAFKNWEYKSKEDFLNWKPENIGSPWIEEAIKL